MKAEFEAVSGIEILSYEAVKRSRLKYFIYIFSVVGMLLCFMFFFRNVGILRDTGLVVGSISGVVIPGVGFISFAICVGLTQSIFDSGKMTIWVAPELDSAVLIDLMSRYTFVQGSEPNTWVITQKWIR